MVENTMGSAEVYWNQISMLRNNLKESKFYFQVLKPYLNHLEHGNILRLPGTVQSGRCRYGEKKKTRIEFARNFICAFRFGMLALMPRSPLANKI